MEVEEAQGGATRGIFAYLNAYMREKKAKRDGATEALKKALNADGTPAAVQPASSGSGTDDAAVAAEFSASNVAATNDLLDCQKLAGAQANQIRFEANSYLTSGADGAVYFASKTAVYRWLPYVNERENNTNNDQGKLFSVPESQQRSRDRDGSGRDGRNGDGFTMRQQDALDRLEEREAQLERDIQRLQRRRRQGEDDISALEVAQLRSELERARDDQDRIILRAGGNPVDRRAGGGVTTAAPMNRELGQYGTVEIIAGHVRQASQRDGFGPDARFCHLKRPVYSYGSLFIREQDNRFCRVHLSNYKVETLDMKNVDPKKIVTYGVSRDGDRLFVICSPPFRVFVARTQDVTASTLASDMA